MGSTFITTMLQTLKLLLPALIPSWRFFDTIAPSPRIAFAVLKTAQDTPGHWQEFRPRPARLALGETLKRLFWNPRWNQTLFLVSCAERLMENPTEHSEQQIRNCIQAELKQTTTDETAPPYLQFRLVLVSRDGVQLQKDVTYISPVHRYQGDAPS